MKKAILAIALVAGSVYILHNRYFETKSAKPSQQVIRDSYRVEQPICVVYSQDVSQSITDNGVEVVNSDIFNEFYSDAHRDIELYFGCIAATSAQKLINLSLPRAHFVKPVLPQLHGLQVTLRRKCNIQYAADLRQYQSDSAAFYTDRAQRVEAFKRDVDTLVNSYRNHLTNETDLVTAVAIADKVFNASVNSNVMNYLILNSDGQDSFHRTAGKLKNPATVLLVNASAISSTSLDSILTKTFESSEQAIHFTLTNQN